MKLLPCLCVISVLAVGCADKAKPKLAECVTAEARNDVLAAKEACTLAVALDPLSESGKAAAEKLKAMQPAIEKAERERADAERLAAEERSRAEEAARAAAASAQKARYKAMPKILNDKIYEQAKWDLGRGTDTSVLAVISKELGEPVASYEGSYGIVQLYVWGETPASMKRSDIRATPFNVEMLRGLTCGDYTPSKVEYYSYGEHL